MCSTQGEQRVALSSRQSQSRVCVINGLGREHTRCGMKQGRAFKGTAAGVYKEHADLLDFHRSGEVGGIWINVTPPRTVD